MIPPQLLGIAGKVGIRGFAMIGLAIALGIVMWRADVISGQRDHEREQRIEANLKLGVSNASIATLTDALAVYIDDGKARRIAGLAAIEAQAEKSAKLRTQADAIRDELEALTPAPDQCRTPDFVMER